MKIIKNLIKYSFRIILLLTIIIFTVILTFVLYVNTFTQIEVPEVSYLDLPVVEELGRDNYILGNNWLKKNQHGIWEMYIQGSPYQRGLNYGVLSKELCQEQEKIFVNQIDNFVPNETLQKMVRLLIGFFNRNIANYIPVEYQQEIYGVSQSFSDEYDYIASKYMRILNYHAAHDIGHALNDYSVVGCTSFAVKGEKTKADDLLVGRNFDFYVGDEFAKQKLLLFVEPDSGYSFCSYSWAGFMGVASGLNNEGLSVTINASKSDIPTISKMPISLLAREILQYASTIEEALAIAKNRETFVSETILVSSKKDGTAALIEKSPTEIGVYFMENEQLLCTNHYQSETFKENPINIENIRLSDSKHRHNRLEELLAEQDSLEPFDVATILRDQKGTNGANLGLGNPRAINQLIAHHSVVIAPEKLTFYVSTTHYQLNTYLGYNLDSIFSGVQTYSDSIQADSFLVSKEYQLYKKFKGYKKNITHALLFGKDLFLSEEEVLDMIASNPEYYITYELLANYFLLKENPEQALVYLNLSLTKNIASLQELERLKKMKYNLENKNN